MSDEKIAMTESELREIRQRYAPPNLPPCKICGAQLSIQSRDWKAMTYACSSISVRDPDWADHFEQTKVTLPACDDRVIRLLDEFYRLRDIVRSCNETTKEVAMPEIYEFELTLEYTGDGEFDFRSQENQDRLYEAGLNDAMLAMRQGQMYVVFGREHDSRELAIQSAIEDIERANLGLKATIAVEAL